MLYQKFVLLRVPVSAIAMLCLGLGVSAALANTGGGALGFVVALGGLVFIAVVTGKLANCQPDALAWAGGCWRSNSRAWPRSYLPCRRIETLTFWRWASSRCCGRCRTA